ncbi:alpha/beta fold hydrolase [Radicibacter daui]|uniref:alpha/beta fold hydrolase n=1 Tax=Radicibacter daui TaxID=3064829 RepID=UPI004046E265
MEWRATLELKVSAIVMGMNDDLAILFLHALPLDGSMWDAFGGILPGATYAPTLYGYGASLEEWAKAALEPVKQQKLIVVGCSVGGSCAIEVASLAPERVAALVLIGTKAAHRHDPNLRDSALALLAQGDVVPAWRRYWAPLFSQETAAPVIAAASAVALRQGRQALCNGILAFHSRLDRSDIVRRLAAPIVVISGEDDTAPGPRHSAQLANSAQKGTFLPVPRCGHYVPLEQPAILLNVLRRVIADVTAAPPQPSALAGQNAL